MSANNWIICPKCQAKAEKTHQKKRAKVLASYGQVSREEYEEALSKVPDKPASLETTFREDYEIGLDGDDFMVVYRGSCGVCDFRHAFDVREQVKL